MLRSSQASQAGEGYGRVVESGGGRARCWYGVHHAKKDGLQSSIDEGRWGPRSVLSGRMADSQERMDGWRAALLGLARRAWEEGGKVLSWVGMGVDGG